MELQAKHHHLRWGERPFLMGIVNVTPDSFFDGGRWNETDVAVAHALRLVEEGADLLDFGGESSRPGSLPVDESEELRRVIPVITAVAKAVSVPLSVDTTKAAVARAALDAGASIVNDITGLRGDDQMVDVVAQAGAGLVLMHMQGTSQTMQRAPSYNDVVDEVATFFSERLQVALEGGVARSRIILDPGIGFGKLLSNNLDLLDRLDAFLKFGCPLLVGPSRKSFLGEITGRPVADRMWGTASAVALAVARGAAIIRVHDVREMRDVVMVASAIAKRGHMSLREQHA
jgi:dihydropteroate synthase